MKSISVILFAIIFSSFANAASFQGETTFTTNPIWGRLDIRCSENGMSEWRYVTCEDLRLSPFEYGFLDAEKNTGATEVLITSQRADGKSVEKKVGYDSAAGRSEKRVNLWILTLLQNPLLDVGNNVISYELVDGDQVKASGQFNVNVVNGEEKQCPNDMEWSYSMTDCRFPETACSRYFQRYNYCQ